MTEFKTWDCWLITKQCYNEVMWTHWIYYSLSTTLLLRLQVLQSYRHLQTDLDKVCVHNQSGGLTLTLTLGFRILQCCVKQQLLSPQSRFNHCVINLVMMSYLLSCVHKFKQGWVSTLSTRYLSFSYLVNNRYLLLSLMFI